MKNLMIYISPTGSFNNPRSDLVSNDADFLIKVQIDNSLALGWKKEDILLVTNFEYQYKGIEAIVFRDVEFFKREPQASKINAIIRLFERYLIRDLELYWFHDLDAFQLQPITEAEINLSNNEIALTAPSGIFLMGENRISTGSIFFKSGSKDLFYRIREVMYRGSTNEENALSVLTMGDWATKQRVRRINNTYNFTGYDLLFGYKQAKKPLKVVHFHHLAGIKQFGIENCLRFFMGENEINTSLITERLIKIFELHGIKPPLVELKPIKQVFNADLGKSYTTHMGVLTKVLLMSKGDVLELGVGPASTPLLHWLCKDMNRLLISYENNSGFFQYARRYQSQLHRVRFVKDWDGLDTVTRRGLVFIDHAPFSRRETDAIRFKDSADYIIINNTNGWKDHNDVWKHFKYIYTWKKCLPWVSVVSNTKDLSKL
jgi:hypothetical protein